MRSRTVHKWIAVAISVPFLAWCVSGIVMVIPQSWLKGPAGPRGSGNVVDLAAVQVSPAEAVAAIERRTGETARVHELQIRMFAGQVIYDVKLASGRHLLKASTGEPVEITLDVAKAIAVQSVGTDAPVRQVDVLSERDYHYYGPVPAYRIQFADPPETTVYVETQGGKVDRWSRNRRIHNWVTGIHMFKPLQLIPGGAGVREAVLAAVSFVSTFAAVTGLWIVLPIRRRQ